MNKYDTIKSRVDRISDTSCLKADQLPTSAKVEVCGKCTLNCKFCINKSLKENGERQQTMSNDMFDIVLKFLKTIPTLTEVGLFYIGESGLDVNLPYRYKRLKELGYFTYLTTNGTVCDTILKSIPYVDSLKVSWNYANLADFKNKTMANAFMYDNIQANISKFFDECHRFGKQLTVSTIVDTNKDDYSDVLKMLKFDQHYWLPLQSQYDVNENAVGGVVGQYDNQRQAIPCWSLFKSLYVDVDGNVRQCCYGHTEQHVLYNIKNVNAFYLPKQLIELRKMHLNGIVPTICKNCK